MRTCELLKYDTICVIQYIILNFADIIIAYPIPHGPFTLTQLTL